MASARHLERTTNSKTVPTPIGKGLLILTWRDSRIYFVNPIIVGFYIALPMLIMVIFSEGFEPAFELMLGSGLAGNLNLSPAQQVVPGFALFFAIFSLGSLGQQIPRDKDSGAWKRFLVMPIWRPALPLAWGVAFYVLAAVQSLSLFILGRILLGMEFGDVLGVVTVLLVFSLVPVGLGILLSSVFNSGATNQFLAVVLGLVFTVFSGGFIPLFLGEDWVQKVAYATPNYYAIDALHGLMGGGENLGDVWPNIVALLAYAILPLLLGLRFFQRKNYL